MDSLTFGSNQEGAMQESADLAQLAAAEHEEKAAIFWSFLVFVAGVAVIRVLPFGLRLFS